jgi:hypothetical protein
MFKYKYEKPEDLTPDTNAIIEEGEAMFTILSVQGKKENGYPLETKNGAPMLRLLLKCQNGFAHTCGIYVYLIADQAKRIYDLDKAIGGGLYNEMGQLDERDLVKKSGKCYIKVGKYVNNNGQEVQKMELAYFIDADVKSTPSFGSSSDSFDDAVPF